MNMTAEGLNKWVLEAGGWAAVTSVLGATACCLVPAWGGHLDKGSTIGGLVGLGIVALKGIFTDSPKTDEALIECLDRADDLFFMNQIDIEEYQLMRWL